MSTLSRILSINRNVLNNNSNSLKYVGFKFRLESSAGDKPAAGNRPVRQEPAKVIACLIPEHWPTLFYPVTGVTGFWTFCFTVGIYCLSKEKLVMEHEYYGGLSQLVLWTLVVKYMGAGFAKSLDKKIDEYEAGMTQSRTDETNVLKEQIEDEENLQQSAEGQIMLVQAKRENVDLQLEAEYRIRLMEAYRTVKRRLDYQVSIGEITRRLGHLNMVHWVVHQVRSSITQEQEKANIDKCIETLEGLAQ